MTSLQVARDELAAIVEMRDAASVADPSATTYIGELDLCVVAAEARVAECLKDLADGPTIPDDSHEINFDILVAEAVVSFSEDIAKATEKCFKYVFSLKSIANFFSNSKNFNDMLAILSLKTPCTDDPLVKAAFFAIGGLPSYDWAAAAKAAIKAGEFHKSEYKDACISVAKDYVKNVIRKASLEIYEEKARGIVRASQSCE